MDLLAQLIAALATGSGLTVLTKFLLDKSKQSAQQPIDQYESLVDRLEKRIAALELDHKKCLEDSAAIKYELGKVTGMLEEQREGLNNLRETNTRQSMQAVRLAGEVASKSLLTAASLASNSPLQQPINIEHPLPIQIIESAHQQS